GRLDVVREVTGGVYIDVRVIAQVDGGDPEAALLVDPMIAAALVRRDVGPERVLRTARRAYRARHVAIAGGAERTVYHVAPEHLFDVVGHRGDRPRRTGDVQHGLRDERIGADHVEVNRGFDATGDLGIFREIRDGARHLGRPDETDRARRRWHAL